MSSILTFESVAAVAGPYQGGSLVREISFSLGPGEMVLLRSDHASEAVPYLDLAIGLKQPDQGRICFGGTSWADMSYPEQLAARSRIGTLPREQVWLSHQGVLQNVLLRLRHHTNRPEGELTEEADALARCVGLEAVPRVRRDMVPPRQLRMAGWVRAFVGEPRLLVLHSPERGAVADWPGILNDLLAAALARGAGVFVISDQPRLWELPVMAQAKHCKTQDGIWVNKEAV